MVIVLMGVSGSGKSTIGRALAKALGWPFLEADDYHSPESVAKMTSGVALTDLDRGPWLDRLREEVFEACSLDSNAVLACSALKESYRDRLERGTNDCVRYVYLTAPEEVIRKRLEAREGHFMSPALLRSQFEALELPERAVTVDVTPPPDVVVAAIRRELGL